MNSSPPSPPQSDRATLFSALGAWQKTHGRHHLPWQKHSPYGVWISEVMLQQTQVETVIRYFERWVRAFPTPESLSKASMDEIMTHWRGLGYYRRAEYLKSAAESIVLNHQGQLPRTLKELTALKGIGRSTAGAILSLGFGLRGVILEGNTKRVLCRFFGLKEPSEAQLWALAESAIPKESEVARESLQAYTQGLMDLGSAVCLPKNPKCSLCPLSLGCKALASLEDPTLFSPKKTRPKVLKVQEFWLLPRWNDHTYLRLNESKGIWRKLYLPLRFHSKEACDKASLELSRRFGGAITQSARLSHKLTHRDLEIQAFVFELERPLPGSLAQPFLPLALESLGLPRPLARWLEALNPEEGSLFS